MLLYSDSPLSPTLAKWGLIGEDWVWKPNDEYYNAIGGQELYDYEKRWLLANLFIANELKLSSNDKDNLHNMMNIIFPGGKIRAV